MPAYNVVLVVPPYDVGKSLGTKSKSRRGNLPPLGAGFLAATLQERGHQVRFIDASAAGLDVDTTVAAALDAEPDLVGISCLTLMAEAGYALATALKAARPELVVVMGGPHVTNFPDTALEECPALDAALAGEAENTFADLVDRASRGERFEGIGGLVSRDESGAVVMSPPPPPIKDLDMVPHPARDIYDTELYRPLPNQRRREPATTMITSRGCAWGKCKFCYQGGPYSQHYRRISPEYAVEEVRQLVREQGFREIIFWDDNFCVKPTWINRFCDLLDQESLDVTWTVQARVDTVKPDMLKRMAASGCYSVYYGFENGNQDILDLVSKGITLEQSRQAVRWSKEAGMEVRGSFILGLPTDTPEKAENTIRFACELDVEWLLFFPYRAQQGTLLEELARLEGVIHTYDMSVSLPPYVPKGFDSREELAQTVKKAYRRYYLRPSYIMRALWRSRRPVVFKNYASAFMYWLRLMCTKASTA